MRFISSELKERNNIYHMYITYADKDNKIRKTSKTTKLKIKTGRPRDDKNNKKEAEQMLIDFVNEFKQSINSNKFIIGMAGFNKMEEPTFYDYLNTWIKYKENHSKKKPQETTITGYIRKNNVIRRYLEEQKWDTLKVSDITWRHIQKFYDDKEDEGISQSTIRKYHNNIRQTLDLARRNGFISENPAKNEDIIIPDPEEYVAETLNEEEITQCLALFKGTDYWLSIYLSCNYGLRRSEVLGLRWKDIDFDNNMITLSNTLYETVNKETKQYEVKAKPQMKNKKSRRTLPLTEEVKSVLINWKNQQEKYKKLCGKSYVKAWDGYVCTRSYGDIIKPDTLSRAFADTLKKNRFKKVRLHDLRHSFATILLRKGINLQVISKLLGHSTYAITAKTYAHVDDSDKEIPIGIISDIMNTSEKKEEADKEGGEK